jgi:hypothetical protein
MEKGFYELGRVGHEQIRYSHKWRYGYCIFADSTIVKGTVYNSW